MTRLQFCFHYPWLLWNLETWVSLRSCTQLLCQAKRENLHVGECVFGPAVDTLDLLACDCCLRVICVLITALFHKFIQTVVADLNTKHISITTSVIRARQRAACLTHSHWTYNIGATVFAAESCDLAQGSFTSTVIAASLWLQVAILLEADRIFCTWLLVIARPFRLRSWLWIDWLSGSSRWKRLRARWFH